MHTQDAQQLPASFFCCPHRPPKSRSSGLGSCIVKAAVEGRKKGRWEGNMTCGGMMQQHDATAY